MGLRKLTRNEWNELDIQYSVTPGLSDTMGASGEHYILISILNRLGFYPRSREEAMDLSEQILGLGWQE